MGSDVKICNFDITLGIMNSPSPGLNASTPSAVGGLAPRTFLSYSRKDLAFVQRLSHDLNAHACFCDYDVAEVDPQNILAGISPEDEWWKRLQDMIVRAQVVVFVLSSNSLRSKVCDEEVGFALSSGKRVVAVTYGTIDISLLPPRMSALNIAIHLGTGEGPTYERSLQKLVSVIQLDVAWHRFSADVAVAASKWNALARGREALMGGAELQALQEWASRRPASATPFSELVLTYMSACHEAEIVRVAELEAERERFLELMEVVTPMLEAEVQARVALFPSSHPGVRKEQEVELERVKSLLGKRWHPTAARHIASTGATEGYAEIFVFSCCNKMVRDFLSTGEADPPLQFRADGCQDIPSSLQHSQRTRSNPFRPVIVSLRGGESRSESSDDV